MIAKWYEWLKGNTKIDYYYHSTKYIFLLFSVLISSSALWKDSSISKLASRHSTHLKGREMIRSLLRWWWRSTSIKLSLWKTWSHLITWIVKRRRSLIIHAFWILMRRWLRAISIKRTIWESLSHSTLFKLLIKMLERMSSWVIHESWHLLARALIEESKVMTTVAMMSVMAMMTMMPMMSMMKVKMLFFS